MISKPCVLGLFGWFPNLIVVAFAVDCACSKDTFRGNAVRRLQWADTGWKNDMAYVSKL